MTDDLPLFAPGDRPLSADLVRELAQLAHSADRMFPVGAERKRQAFRRYQIWRGELRPFVIERICEIYTNKRVRDALAKFASNALHPARDIVNSVCQVYTLPCRRSLAGVRASKALQDLYAAARVDSLASEWLRLAYFVGPVCVIPAVSARSASCELLLPHTFDVVLDEDDPHGQPAAVAFATKRGGADFAVVDAGGWRWFKRKPGGPVLVDRRDTSGKPFATLRTNPAVDAFDWYTPHAGERLVSGGIEAGLIWAQLGHVRKSQNKRLLRVQGEVSSIPKGQGTADPEGALVLPVKNNQPLDASTLDFDTPPQHFIAHLRLLHESMAESTGVQLVSVASQNGSAMDPEFSFDGLTEIRNAMLPHCREFEHDLARAMVASAKEFGHPSAEVIGDDLELRLDFAGLSRRFADPRAEAEHADWRMRHGLSDPIEMLRREHPDKSDVELEAIQAKHLERTSRWHDEITKRNLATGPSGEARTAAEAYGAEGPRAR